MSKAMKTEIEAGLHDPPERSAPAVQRRNSLLAAEAIREFVETNEWQIAEIHAALKEADADDFASDKDVAALARNWKGKAPLQRSLRRPGQPRS